MLVGTSITQVTGGTPVVQLTRVVPDGAADVFVKLEWFNPTGSYKDRMALAVIEEAERRGDLRPGMTVVEYTGGSTGSSLAFVCAAKGYRVHLVSTDAVAEEKLRTMQALGAELTIVPSVGGMITPDLIPRMHQVTLQLAAERDTFWTDQFHNADALVGYSGVGLELIEQLDRPITAFCAGVGTAGLIMGVASAFEEVGSSTRIVALEPAETPVISGGAPGDHHIEGIGVGFVPPLLDLDRIDEVRVISESDARVMARRLAAEEGLLAGTSSGLNVVGAIRVAEELGPGHVVVTVACDTGLKYLAGDLYAR